MNGRRWLVVLCIVGAALAWLLWPREEETPPSEAPTPATAQAQDDDVFSFFAEMDPSVPATDSAAPATDEASRQRRTRADTEEERRKRFRLRRRRFRNMSPEQRREWVRRRVSIEPLEDAKPTLEPEDVMDALRATRPELRACMEGHGGFRAMRDAMRTSMTADAGAGRRGMTLSFDVSADGRARTDSLAIEPAPPEPFYQCFMESLAAADLPPADAPAHVELRFGGRGRASAGRPQEQAPREPPTQPPLEKSPAPL